jgi:hypothetical protein
MQARHSLAKAFSTSFQVGDRLVMCLVQGGHVNPRNTGFSGPVKRVMKVGREFLEVEVAMCIYQLKVVHVINPSSGR